VLLFTEKHSQNENNPVLKTTGERKSKSTRMKRTTLVVALWAMVVTSADAQKKGDPEQQLVKDANALFEARDFLKAYPLFSQLVSLNPNSGEYAFKFGACAVYTDADKSKAIRFLNSATKKQVPDPLVWYYLGKAYHLNYQFKEAVGAYETFVTKADPKLVDAFQARREIETCIYGSTLLSNIKDLVVLDKKEADRESFFRYMDLNGIGGKILTVPDELKSAIDKKKNEPSVIHYPGDATTIYFASYGKDESNGKDIYRAQLLPDGKFTSPEKVKGGVNSKYDEDFCFMHSDGKTLYFSSRGHNSMGGYDIFKSQMDIATGVFGPAINMDFAINTPDDDIFFIADSLNQTAYFASGRASDQKHLHVYSVRVEGIPLQIVYLKGQFASTFDAELKKANIDIKDPLTGRSVSKTRSDVQSGDYLLYVPKSGTYTYEIISENSPTKHAVEVSIPQFDKPMAFRQEIRLSKENGQERVEVINHFEEPLEEDLAALAAEMLRAKAGLEINATREELEKTATEQTNSPAMSVEKTLVNAPVIAGFGEGISIAQVLQQMETAADDREDFVMQSNGRIESALSYASLQQKEADALLIRAETMRANTQGYSSDGDIKSIKESVVLTAQAEEMQRKAKSALLAAQTLRSEVELEQEKVDALIEQISALKAAESASNFDAAFAVLKTEKERQVAERMEPNSTHDQLLNKAKAIEAQQRKAQDTILQLREDEKKETAELAEQQRELAATKKKNDKLALETQIANTQSDLDATRRSIAKETMRVETMSTDSKNAYAHAEFYQQLQSNPTLGLDKMTMVKLDATQAAMLQMKIDALATRVEALAITDPAMKAIITDSRTDSLVVVKSERVLDESKSQNPYEVTEIAGKGVSGIASKKDNALGLLAASGSVSNASKGLVLGYSLNETAEQISALQRLGSSNLSTEQRAELETLVATRSALTAELQALPAPAAVAPERVASMVTEVVPTYDAELKKISAQKGSDLSIALAQMEWKKSTLDRLQKERATNASLALQQNSATAIEGAAERDAVLAAAIAKIEKENQTIQPVKVAYESAIQETMESNLGVAEKLDEQALATQTYLSHLEQFEYEVQVKLEQSNLLEEKNELSSQIAVLQQEQATANMRLTSYTNDRALTTTTSPAPSNSVASQTTNENRPIAPSKTAVNKASTPEEQAEQIRTEVLADGTDIARIFEQKEEVESIFAYENGGLKALMDEHREEGSKLRNLEKIAEIQSEIFTVESEIQKETNVAKMKKMDRQAEELYQKKAYLELGNTSYIKTLTGIEFKQQWIETNQKITDNKLAIEGQLILKDEVQLLTQQAQAEMAEAEAVRLKAGSMSDVIEKNDYYRQAFAKETHAISLLEKARLLIDNAALLANYNPEEMADMRTGNASVVAEKRIALLAKPALAETEKASTFVPYVTEDGTAEVIFVSNNKTLPTKKTEPEPAAETPVVVTPKPTQPEVIKVTTAPTVAATTAPAPQPKETTEDATPVSEVKKSETVQATTELPVEEKAPVVVPPVAVVKPTESSVTIAPKAADNKITKEELDALGINLNAPKAASSSPTEAKATADVASTSTQPAAAINAEEFIYTFPEVVISDYFTLTRNAAYSTDKPIPVDAPMPSGVYYKIQIGAFRNAIPQNLFDEFAPVSGESVGNGLVRYSAGFFQSYDRADQVKMDIRRMGYGDAFVVAYRDGKRIPMYDAMRITEKNPEAELAKETADKAGTGTTGKVSNPAPSPKPTETTATAPAAKLPETASTDAAAYYTGFSDAAPAVQVETTKGLFYTVQVGVYSKPTPAAKLFNIAPLNSELTSTQKIRYTAGRFANLQDAVNKRAEARRLGLLDAFITVYYNGKRITMSEADALLKEQGAAILYREP
jgi:hypothetical protein